MSINSEALDLTGLAIRIDASALEIAGTAVTATAAELNAIAGNGLSAAELAVLDGVTAGTVTAGKAIVTTTSKHIDALVITDGGLALGAGAGTAVTATAAELNYNDVATLGTLAASKAWTSDSSLYTIMPSGSLLTVQSGGAVTFNSGSTLTVSGTMLVDGTTTTTVEAAEHGAGAIGTSSFGAPKTYRWTDKGVIVTQIKFDLTGLASVATANDVIGLAVGGTANIGRNVVATNGVIFKAELSCLETTTGGDNDVNVVTSSTSTLAYDSAGGTAYVSNSGDLLAGQTIQNLVPAMTEGDYFYLTAGTGDTAATYTAGMYILTLYGHALLA